MSNITVSPHELRVRYSQYLTHTEEIIKQKVYLQQIGLKHRVIKPDGVMVDVYEDKVMPLLDELDAIIQNQFEDIVLNGSMMAKCIAKQADVTLTAKCRELGTEEVGR